VIPLEEAQRFVRGSIAPLPPVELPLDGALGCVAAEELRAKERIPGFTNSAMDGYALRAIDTAHGSARLRVIGSVLAGDVSTLRVETGGAVRIMTGAPLPDGADGVCKIEEVTIDSRGDFVLIPRTVRPGENVRHPGEDINVGQRLVEPGDELGPTEIGMLTSQGFTSVLVHPRPRVGVLSTGDELAGSPGTLQGGKIRDLNRPMLLASLRQSGFTPVDLGIIRDDEESVTKTFRKAILRCDAVISTGGVSVGDIDVVKTVILKLCGASARWMQVAIRPGKPFTFGVVGRRATPLFGLPGNPVATLVCFELYARPALRLLGGHQIVERPTVDSILDCPLPRGRDGRLHLVHVTVRFHEDGRLHVESVARQGSHLVSAVAGANAIAMIPDGVGLGAGQSVRTMILDIGGFGTASAWSAS
jgi:molybdenum cofactor synthesis domain-containing protein